MRVRLEDLIDHPAVSIKSSAGPHVSVEAAVSCRQRSLEARCREELRFLSLPGLSGESCKSALIPVAKTHGTYDL